MKIPNLADKPRHPQLSIVRDLVVVPFGFSVSAAGAINAANNTNPPQIYVTAGANNQTYTLRCPNGNPNKIWCYITCEEDIEASVSDFSTIVNGTLTINLHAAPAGNTVMKGFLAYGKNAGEGKGAVSAPPSDIRDFASTFHSPVYGLLRQTMITTVGWTVNGSNVVTSTRGPAGVLVSPQGSGVYHIVWPFNTPAHYPANWAECFGASDGRRVSISHTVVGDLTTTVITFEDGADMGNGEQAGYLLMGPASEYSANYGGASGGVHSNLVSRDVHTYSAYDAKVLARSGSFIPVHVALAAGTSGPVAASSNLPPGMVIQRTGVGVYTIYIGAFDEDSFVAAFNLANGVAVGVTAYSGSAGTITVTAAADPGALTSLQGFITVQLQSQV